MPAIETDGLTKRFGGSVLAVDDLDLEVQEGEIFGFLGPNGAGKSTTINMLLGFATPTAGRARVLGLDARERSRAIHERIGILPEGFGVYDRLSAFEHLRHAVRVKDAPDDPAALLERVGLDADDAERPAGDYSKGMKQRLALGIALVGDPDLLILDEPSSGLDPTGMQEIRDIIREEAADGTTVFFSSHILSEVEAVCDRVGIMNEGRLVTVDDLDALRDDAGVATVEFELADTLEDPGLADLDGVRDVVVDGDRVTVSVTDASEKIRVIRAMDDAATVLDVISEETSLEELFNRYTGNGKAGSPPDDEREPEEVVA